MGDKTLTPEEIQAIIDENASLKEQAKTQDELIQEQTELLEKAQKGSKSLLEVEHEGDTYQIVHGLKVDNVVYSPATIAENADLVADLVKSNSSALRKVEEETE